MMNPGGQMTHRLLCIDIETVPDGELVPPDWPEDKFPKLAWHRIVAISLVEARILRMAGVERYEVTACRSGGEADWDEGRLLRAFWSFLDPGHDRVATWNGRGFDLPVLRLRAMVHGIPAAAWYSAGDKWTNYSSRYSADMHCDLMDQLADHGAASRLGLDDMAHAIGLPGKVGGHGSSVARMVEDGEIEAVRAYCEADCLNLFALYVRWALLTGRTDRAGHDASMESLVACLERDRERRPHFGVFLDAWRASRRPAPFKVSAIVEGMKTLP
ncbi:3'-5' exonuclease [Salinarimonas soli]|uniref:3'-5' exonuclease n=2 Tax=Salinarimonas soli TaxID=1638099 RepID=A0A5B2VC71_9HYPH|nr:3'-5' exonuclease [Salinarimonas soli]